MVVFDLHEWRGRVYAHMMATSLDELHAFAQQLPCRRKWFHNKPGMPHYDLYGICIDYALEMGATPVSTRELVVFARRWYALP